MSAPIPTAVFGLIEERFKDLLNPFSELDLEFSDDDHMD